MEAVRLKDVTKSYGGTNVVDHVDLEVKPGMFTSLLGPSGCGKTTTLRMIAGLIEPDGGEIWIGDRLLSAPGRVVRPEQRGISMIFQSYALWPHMTVFENVAYGVRLRQTLRSGMRQRVLAVLDLVKMADYADRYPGELSGGQQQRIALARAVAIEPAVLLMDEPLSNLDASLREEMRFEIRRLHDEVNITTVYVTHDLAEAMVVSDTIAVMNQGRIEQLGTPAEIYERPRTRFVAGFIGHTTFLLGTVEGDGTVRLGEGGPRLRVSFETQPSVGQQVTLALRPHDVTMSRRGLPVNDGRTPLEGTVVRQVYLGDFREYTVNLHHLDIPVRVMARSEVRFEHGETVSLEISPEKCRMVPA